MKTKSPWPAVVMALLLVAALATAQTPQQWKEKADNWSTTAATKLAAVKTSRTALIVTYLSQKADLLKANNDYAAIKAGLTQKQKDTIDGLDETVTVALDEALRLLAAANELTRDRGGRITREIANAELRTVDADKAYRQQKYENATSFYIETVLIANAGSGFCERLTTDLASNAKEIKKLQDAITAATPAK